VPNKPNTSKEGSLTAAERHFVDDVARLLVPWGVPQTAARLYGYLLLSPKPVSLDRITVAVYALYERCGAAEHLADGHSGRRPQRF
jgi:hypothetical protein